MTKTLDSLFCAIPVLDSINTGTLPAGNGISTDTPHSDMKWVETITHSAASQLWLIEPAAQTGSASAGFTSSNTQDHYVMEFAIKPSANPADPVSLVLISSNIAGPTAADTPTVLLHKTNGTIEVIAGDFSTVLATLSALSTSDYTWFRIIADGVGGSKFRVRIIGWSAATGWDMNSPLFDHSTTNNITSGGVYRIGFYSQGVKGVANPAVTYKIGACAFYHIGSDADLENIRYIPIVSSPNDVSSDSAQNDYTGGPPATNPDDANVNEDPPGDDAGGNSYDQSPGGIGATHQQLYQMGALFANVGSRQIVAVVQAARMQGLNNGNYSHRVMEQSTSTTNANNMNNGGQWASEAWRMESPPSGGAWSQTIIEAGEGGAQNDSSAANTIHRIGTLHWATWVKEVFPQADQKSQPVALGLGVGIV